jgi:hypothetical protein
MEKQVVHGLDVFGEESHWDCPSFLGTQGAGVLRTRARSMFDADPD